MKIDRMRVFVTREDESRYVVDPYLPVDGYLALRPDRAGWGVEMDEKVIAEDGYVHWQRRVPLNMSTRVFH